MQSVTTEKMSSYRLVGQLQFSDEATDTHLSVVDTPKLRRRFSVADTLFLPVSQDMSPG